VGKVAGTIAARTVGPVVGSALRAIDRSSPGLGYAVRRTSGVGAADALAQIRANGVRPRLVDTNPDLRYPVKSLVQRPAPPPRVESPPVKINTTMKEAPAKVGAFSVSGGSKPSGAVTTGTDALRIEHKQAAGHGFPGVGVTANGGPTFEGTPYLYPVKDGKQNIVRIKMNGDYYSDFADANEAAGFPRSKTPDDHTWHHLDDFDPKSGECTMQLVRSKVHVKTIPHQGGVKQYMKFHNYSGKYGQQLR